MLNVKRKFYYIINIFSNFMIISYELLNTARISV